jgi:hypothetical protein
MTFSINLAQLAFVISCISIYVSFINVNRQRKATLKNEEEKFKRELNLKTSDEFIEILHDMLVHLRNYRGLEHSLNDVLKNNSDNNIAAFNESMWKIIESWIADINKVESYYLKRNVVLKNHEDNILKIKNIGSSADSELWKFKIDFFTLPINEHYNQVLNNKLKSLTSMAEELIDLVGKTIREVQSDFLGHLYK